MKFRSITLGLWLMTGIASAAPSAQQAYTAIYDNILQRNADRAVDSCAQLQRSIGSDKQQTRLTAFTDLATSWARVEASYILGSYDMDAMDYPLLVDYFHAGKEDVHQSLTRIAAGDAPVAKALYKNSYKNLGALDDVMFSADWTPRRQQMAELITTNICKNLKLVQAGYRDYRDSYLADQKKALSLLINAEIESIYKTRDWRIAQISGLTKQNLGTPQPQNQQYPYSKASWAVIGAIVETHEQLLAENQQPNLATITHQNKAESGMEPVQEALQSTLEAYRTTPPDHNFDTQYMIAMFQGLLDMQKAFYRHLVDSIGVTAAIIDADGD